MYHLRRIGPRTSERTMTSQSTLLQTPGPYPLPRPETHSRELRSCFEAASSTLTDSVVGYTESEEFGT